MFGVTVSKHKSDTASVVSTISEHSLLNKEQTIVVRVRNLSETFIFYNRIELIKSGYIFVQSTVVPFIHLVHQLVWITSLIKKKKHLGQLYLWTVLEFIFGSFYSWNMHA